MALWKRSRTHGERQEEVAEDANDVGVHHRRQMGDGRRHQTGDVVDEFLLQERHHAQHRADPSLAKRWNPFKINIVIVYSH